MIFFILLEYTTITATAAAAAVATTTTTTTSHRWLFRLFSDKELFQGFNTLKNKAARTSQYSTLVRNSVVRVMSHVK